MEHLAIMNKSWKLIPKILAGEKTIESRWYKAKFPPWDKIKRGDTVYFKNSGEPVTARAKVSNVIQFENLSPKIITNIVKKYGKAICLQDANYKKWVNGKKYCILIFLKNPEKIQPFNINKAGYGMSAAWITVDNMNKIKK